MDKDEIKNMHVALGEAVMSILDNQSALNNQTIMERLQQLAEAEHDEEKVAAYWQARKAFRQLPQSAPGLRQQDASNTDSKIVKMPPNRFAPRKARGRHSDEHE